MRRFELVAGQVIDRRYRIERVLGEGGMGLVAAATRVELGSRVAIKFLHDDLLGDEMMVRRFKQEARAAAQLHSEHVCQVFDASTMPDGTPFIVMELLEGSDLAKLRKARTTIDFADACRYLLQACVALREAHAAGLVHRDLKPSNLFLARRGDGAEIIKVLDFGIVKVLDEVDSLTRTGLTRTDTSIGTPGYMSPEQLRSAKHVDARTDIWALGVILYELVVGARPFEGESPTDVAIKIATSTAPRITGAGTAVQPIVDRCLQKDPRDRYQDIGHFMSDLETLLATGSVPRDDDAFQRTDEQRTGERTAAARPSAFAPTIDARATVPDRTVDETGRGPVTPPSLPRRRSTRNLVVSSIVVGVVIGAVIYYVAPPRSASRASPLPSPTSSVPAVTTPATTPPDAAHAKTPPESIKPEPVATKPQEQAPAIPAKRPLPKTRPRVKTEATKDDVGARWR